MLFPSMTMVPPITAAEPDEKGWIVLVRIEVAVLAVAAIAPSPESLRVPNLTLATEMAPEPPTRLTEEIAACRKIAPQAIFIMGFARSSTTITSEIINSSPEVLLLGEANWYIPNSHPRFRDWYNAKHRQFGTQITKCSYAPDFIPRAEHSWWESIELAASFYQLVGDKMAFSSHHFQLTEPRQIQAFFEARFFTSRYIFMIRDPVQTMLSAAQLFSITDNGSMIVEIKVLAAVLFSFGPIVYAPSRIRSR